MKKKNTTALRIVLLLAGLFIVLSGLNIGLGGMNTLGWGGQKDFFQVTDEQPFRIQDSHVRFVGGLWLGIGFLFLLAITRVEKYIGLLKFCCCLIFLGGLMRLFQGHPEISFRLPVVGSLIAELVGMPLLYYWLGRYEPLHS